MSALHVHNSYDFQNPVMPITVKLCVLACKVAKVEAGIRTHVFG